MVWYSDAMISPDQAIAFDAVEFFMSMSVANEQARKAAPLSRAELQSSGTTDSKMASFGIAVADRYGNDRIKFESFMLRWKAWSAYLMTNELSRLYPHCEPERLIRCSIECAADCQLTKDGQLERRIFLAKLADRLKS